MAPNLNQKEVKLLKNFNIILTIFDIFNKILTIVEKKFLLFKKKRRDKQGKSITVFYPIRSYGRIK
jgi:hypothetical protein